MAHAGGKGHGRENSVKAILAVNKYRPDIIELDIRKSKDGFLFCYHGSAPFGLLLGYFLRFLKFSTILKLLNVTTLADVLEVTKNCPIIFCDLWQSNISSEDILEVSAKFRHLRIWVGSRLSRQIRGLKRLRGIDKIVYNRSFWNFSKGANLAKEVGADAIKVFFWQCSEKTFEQLRNVGVDYAVSSFLLSKSRYAKLAERWNSLWIHYDSLDGH
ncbi:MAG: glycerophosphodiester phosphodiesterase family protein [Patescibacteria group bacterium]